MAEANIKTPKEESAAKIKVLTSAFESTKAQIASYQTAVQADISKLKRTSEAQINDMKSGIQQTTAEAQHITMKVVGTQIAQTQQALYSQMDELKRELKTESSQSNKVLSDIQHMVTSVFDMQKRQMLQLSSQRFHSTSTLDTVDTGFSETIYEDEEEADLDTQDACEEDVAAIPHFIKDIGFKLETVVHGKVGHLARHLGIDHTNVLGMRDELAHRKDYRNFFWDVIATWCDKCRREHRRITLKDFLDAVNAAGITRQVKPMPHTDRHIIEKNFPMLVDKLLVPVLLVQLRGSGLLCPDDVNYISDCSQQIEKVTRLVDILSILGDQALDSLIRALRESEQRHIAEAIIRSSPTRFPQQDTCNTHPKAANRRLGQGVSLLCYRAIPQSPVDQYSVRVSQV